MGRVKESQATYVVDRHGRKKSIIIPVQEYERLLEDMADLAAIAAKKSEKTIPWEKVKRNLKRDGLL